MAKPLTPAQSIVCIISGTKRFHTTIPRSCLRCMLRRGTIESPLIPHLMGSERGICRGHDEMRPFFEAVAREKPQIRRYYRTGYFSDGKKLMWEYPRISPDGEQMDFVEVM